MANGFQHFGIIGAGAWGTALAATMLRARCDTTIWAFENDVADSINRERQNKYLPEVKLDAKLKATHRLEDIAGCDAWILATPAQHMREIARRLKAVAGANKTPVIIAAKGIEQKTSALLSDVVTAEMPGHEVGILSGPSFAIEVARGNPTALTLAVKNKSVGEALLSAIALPMFRLYLTDDVIGAQVGGAVKNVLAVACGIIAGRNMGENARAALITRGLAELMRLGVVLGGRAETLMGLSGLGDLVLTCSSAQSRNMSLGMALGQGKSLHDILGSRISVAEGIYTAAAAKTLADQYKVEMPVVTAVDAVLNRHADIEAMIAGLLGRPFKNEGA